MERTSKKMTVAHYVRVSVKEPDDQAATSTVDLSKLSDEEIWDGLYIPTQERFFRNPPDDDPSLVCRCTACAANDQRNNETACDRTLRGRRKFIG